MSTRLRSVVHLPAQSGSTSVLERMGRGWVTPPRPYYGTRTHAHACTHVHARARAHPHAPPHAHTRSQTHTRTHTRTHTHSLAHSLTRSLIHSLAHSRALTHRYTLSQNRPRRIRNRQKAVAFYNKHAFNAHRATDIMPPATRTRQHATNHDVRHTACNPQQCELQHATLNLQRSPGTMQHATCQVQHATRNTQRATCNVHETPRAARPDSVGPSAGTHARRTTHSSRARGSW